jgi:hypothetical protein
MPLPFWKTLFWNLLVAAFVPLFLLAALLPSGKRKYLIWGSIPMISNRYWSEAMKEAGHPSLTIMEGWLPINGKADFDRYFADFAPSILPTTARNGVGSCLALLFALRNGRVMHMSFMGFALDRSAFWRLEGWLFRRAGIRTILMPFGADAYMCSKVEDASYRYALLACYPAMARIEARIESRVRYWTRRADVIIAGLMIEGIGRWDVTVNQFVTIDTHAWPAKQDYSANDGLNGPVRVIHTPNHRNGKGSEFVIDAVERLRSEGLQVELILVEGMPNEEVRRLMTTADILAEQFLATGYALSGIEGMASGLAVMANLEREESTRVFRRFGFLDECPILSTSPETLAHNLRLLVTRPELRRQLGVAGRAYAEKYHSYATSRYMFGAIYDSILNGKDVRLINLFHPLLSDYVRATPMIDHPLKQNRLPPGYAPAAKGAEDG